MYAGEGGYLSDSASVKRQLIAAVNVAIAAGLYVIIDWHILSDGAWTDGDLTESEKFAFSRFFGRKVRKTWQIFAI